MWFYVILSIVLIVGMSLFGIELEKNNFNDGICPKCNHMLELKETDQYGCREYVCPMCSYHTNISYKCVDKKFLQEKSKQYMDNEDK